jgi:hypothetical protein
VTPVGRRMGVPLDDPRHVLQEAADDGQLLVRVALHRPGQIPLQRPEVRRAGRHRGVGHLEHDPAAVVGVPRSADATFGALAVLPLVLLSELAFLVGFGVLLDTFVVRSLLVPAAVALIGDKVWWPSALSRRAPETERELERV